MKSLILPPLTVHAILHTGVRRVALPITPQPVRTELPEGGAILSWQARPSELIDNIHSKWPDALLEYAPYKPGQTLWVKETWAQANGTSLEYRADTLAAKPKTAPRWRSPAHLPYQSCRLLLEVTRVHAQPVQQVTERGAQVEGVTPAPERGGKPAFLPFTPHESRREVAEYRRAREAYESRWQHLYQRKYPWESNPWVWRVDFNLTHP